MVCECILVLCKKKEISWQAAKAMMSEPGFLRSLMEMDCDAIGANQVKTVKGRLSTVSVTIMKKLALLSMLSAALISLRTPFRRLSEEPWDQP